MYNCIIPGFFLNRRFSSSTQFDKFLWEVKPVAVAEWVARPTAEQEVGGSPGIPLLKHACGEGDWLLCWHYTLAKVSHQR